MIPPLTEDEKRRLRSQESRIEIIKDFKNRANISIAIAFRVVESYHDGFREGLKYAKKGGK